MKLVFFGSGEFGLPTLASLAEKHEILMVVTQPDRQAGRGKKLTPTPIGTWAEEKCLPLLKTESVNKPEVREELRSLGAEAFVVIAFGQKLKKKLLDGVFALNLHASLLPRWRGAAPIHHAILAGDEVTGNSVIALASRMDAGVIYAQSQRRIEDDMTTGDLHDLLAADGPELVDKVLAAASAGELQGREQDEARVTLATRLSKADGWVSFQGKAREALKRIHGLSPWPGVTAFLGDKRLLLHRVEVVDRDSQSSEEDCGKVDEQGIVTCREGRLKILQVQPAGKRAMSFTDYLRGHPLGGNAVLRSGKDADLI